MRGRTVGSGVLLAMFAVAAFGADSAEVAEGKAIYDKDCMVCHGSNEKAESSPFPQRDPVRLALQQSAGVMADAADWSLALEGSHGGAGTRLAIAPPFGPNLRGIVGRKAGSVEGFQYSSAFLTALRDMEWTEAALGVWITDPQAWVPGVIMFYKQPDEAKRRKIIEYLKANP